MLVNVITCSECKYFSSYGRKGEALAKYGQAYDCQLNALLDPQPDSYCMKAEKIIKEKALKTPCDLCRYNPPGSGDGKPCTMCPAMGRM